MAIATKTAVLLKELPDHITADDVPMAAAQFSVTTMALKKALLERALAGELTHHLGSPLGAARPGEEGNYRNSPSAKTIQTEGCPLRNEVSLYRAGTFEPLPPQLGGALGLLMTSVLSCCRMKPF